MLKVNLDREALLNAGASVSKKWKGTGDYRQQVDVLTINDVKVEDYGGGNIYVIPDDLLADVPKALQSFVSEVSYYDNFGNGLSPNRRLGQYQYASAAAELSVVGSGRDIHYHVKMRAKNLTDLRELNRLIRQGQIWPAIDYETKQAPPPYRHLRDLVSEAGQLIRRNVRDRLYRIRERVVG